MLSNANDFEPIIVLSDEHSDNPSEDELKLVLQFMPDIYRDMLNSLHEQLRTFAYQGWTLLLLMPIRAGA